MRWELSGGPSPQHLLTSDVGVAAEPASGDGGTGGGGAPCTPPAGRIISKGSRGSRTQLAVIWWPTSRGHEASQPKPPARHRRTRHAPAHSTSNHPRDNAVRSACRVAAPLDSYAAPLKHSPSLQQPGMASPSSPPVRPRGRPRPERQKN